MQIDAMKSVFLVETPLSYINALEAQTHFGIKSDESILILTTLWDRNLEQIIAMLDHGRWSDVIYLNYGLENGRLNTLFHQGRLKKYISLKGGLNRVNRLALRLNNVNYLISGYYTHEMILHFSNKVRYREFILIDDGTMTISTNNSRESEKKKNFRRTLFFNGRIKPDYKLFLKYLLGLKDNGISSMTFFTVFNLKVSSFDKLIKNNLSNLGTQINSKINIEKVFFLGSPLTESMPNAMNAEYFEVLIRKIVEIYGAEELIYFPHRNENLEIINKLKEELHFEVRVIKAPFEYYLGHENYVPNKIVSCFTSALFNLTKIVPPSIKIESVRIPDYMLVENGNKNNILEIYKEISNNEKIVTVQI